MCCAPTAPAPSRCAHAAPAWSCPSATTARRPAPPCRTRTPKSWPPRSCRCATTRLPSPTLPTTSSTGPPHCCGVCSPLCAACSATSPTTTSSSAPPTVRRPPPTPPGTSNWCPDCPPPPASNSAAASPSTPSRPNRPPSSYARRCRRHVRGRCAPVTPVSGNPGAHHPVPPGYAERKSDHLDRLHKVEGQVRGVPRMVDDDRCCVDALTQISAVTRALQEVALGLLDDHVRHAQSCREGACPRPPRTQDVRRAPGLRPARRSGGHIGTGRAATGSTGRNRRRDLWARGPSVAGGNCDWLGVWAADAVPRPGPPGAAPRRPVRPVRSGPPGREL
ncbi:metal-sensing transcriptional repressor [Streptomyces sp. NPDC127097]|uniref:metal-sensitive transcriptional regulator n=1 Tax=Streptomyces sp. NPDC127097 TaxID=3347136 RepID=UPI00365A0B45